MEKSNDQIKFERNNSELLDILKACGVNEEIQVFSTKARAINILTDLIYDQHSMPSVDEFNYDLNEPSIESFDTVEEYQESLQDWREQREDALIEWQEENQGEFSEIIEALETLEYKLGEDNFYFDYDGKEYRIISDSALFKTYVDEIQRIVEDCYDLKLDSIPDFVAFSIDWEQTASNALVDGYAHTFSSYDGSTHIEVEGYNIFRVN